MGQVQPSDKDSQSKHWPSRAIWANPAKRVFLAAWSLRLQRSVTALAPAQALFPDLAAECALLPRGPGGGGSRGGGAAVLVDPTRYHSSVRRTSYKFGNSLNRTSYLFIQNNTPSYKNEADGAVAPPARCQPPSPCPGSSRLATL